MANTDPTIQALLDDVSDTLEIELNALGHGETPYLLLILPLSGPQLCGTVTPQGMEEAANLLLTLAAEAKNARPLKVPAIVD